MLNNRKKIIFAFVVVFLFSTFYFLLSISVEAAAPLKLQVPFPCPDFPGAPCPTGAKEKAGESPAAYIARLYQFALALAGMLAFGMIIFGAIQYTVSAGNTAQQSDARDRITQALWGVALLLGAYLILYTIDPKLVNLKDPDITKLLVPAYERPQTIEERKRITEGLLPKLGIEELKTRRQKAENNAKEFKEKFDELKKDIAKKGPFSASLDEDAKLLNQYRDAYYLFKQETEMAEQEISKRGAK